MSRPAIVVPVKGRRWKSRLSQLTLAQRQELTRLLLLDLLSVIRSTGVVMDTFVVTSSDVMARAASQGGARVLMEEEDEGVNSAVYFAMESLPDRDEFVVLPGDLPLLRRSDITRPRSLVRAGMDVVIAPSLSMDGTNLLWFRRSTRFRLSYDSDSFWTHVSEASIRGLKLAVLASQGITSDVDSPADVERVVRSRMSRPSLRYLKEVESH